MSLRENPSALVQRSMQQALEAEGFSRARLLIRVSSHLRSSPSMSANGPAEHGGPGDRDQWLIVAVQGSGHLLFSFETGHEGAKPFFTVSLDRAEDCRIVSGVGTSIFQIRTEGVWIEGIRFDNALKHKFERVRKRVLRLIHGIRNSLNPTDPVDPAESDPAGEDPLKEDEDAIDPYRCPKCGLMLDLPGELCPRCIDHGAALCRARTLLGGHRREAALIFFFLLVGVGLDMIWPMLTRYLVDHVLVHPTNRTRVEFFDSAMVMSSMTLLLWVVGALAGVQVLRAGVNFITAWISSRVGNAMTHEIRQRLVRKLEELGLSYHNKHETGALVGRIAYDTEAIHGFMNQLTSGFVLQFFLVLVSFGMMMSLEPSLALYAMIPAPFVVGGAFAYWRFLHPRFERLWERSSRQAGLLSGILSGMRVVKAFGKEENEINRFKGASQEVRDSRRSLERTGAVFHPAMAIVFQAGGWLIWYVGGKNVLMGKLSLGTLMAFFGYLGMFYGPLGSLTNLTHWLTEFSTQIHRIFDVLDAPTELSQAEVSTPMPPRVRGEVEFRRVNFGYQRSTPVIKEMNLKIRPGETVGIVGPSGSGKTSIANLLCRFYDVDSGQILIDGVDIRKISKDDLRRSVGIVLQEPFVFKGTLAENIAYGRPDASLEEVIEASRAASAHDFIMRRPFAYDTTVGERGHELSGGERQRISIARALLCAPPILVLDEATSSIDTESELVVQKAIEEVTKGRTTLIIAHRLSTLRNCDKICVLEEGRIAEYGSHEELIRLDGRYAKWIRMQHVSVESPASARTRELEATVRFRPRWLEPGESTFERCVPWDLRIRLSEVERYQGVFALRCFPIQYPEKYLSIRHWNPDGGTREVGLIADLSRWPVRAAQWIRDSLEKRYLFRTVRRIHSVRKFGQFLAFSAQTSGGGTEFVLKNTSSSAQKFGQNGRLLRDIEENVYVIPDVGRMPSSDRSLVARYVHWL